MVRPSTLLVACVLMGCDAPSENLRYLSTLPAQARGVTLNDSGTQAFVGMAGMACSIDVNHATIELDIDPSDEEETVEDSSGTLEGGGAVLTSYSGGLHRITESTAQDAMEDWVEPELTLDPFLALVWCQTEFLRSASTKMGVKSPVPTAMPLIKSCASLPRCAIKTVNSNWLIRNAG